MDHAPGLLTNLDDPVDNLKVARMPPNTTSLIQPMDQRVIAKFKACYLWRIFKQMIKFIDSESKPTVREFWHSFNITNAIDNLTGMA